jgi:tRNA(Ile)-lysidine synthase TilS/MesJ
LIIGLAISGGVDSMALAALCSQLQQLSLSTRKRRQWPDLSSLQPLKFRAFIVDHGLRAGSGLEAEAVSKILEARGKIPQLTVTSTMAKHLRHRNPNLEDAMAWARTSVLLAKL